MAFPVSARTTGTLITSTIWNADLKDNLNALQGGTVALEKITINGVASAPSLSPAGDSVIYYNTAEDEIMLSKNGATYSSLGPFPLNDARLVGGTKFGFLRW
jgi:hypothetical protein